MPATARTTSPSPAEIAFWKRSARRSEIKRANGQADIIQLSQVFKRKHLKLPNKNKGGAQKGTRNARTSGLYARETVEAKRQMKARVRAVITEINLHIALLKAATARKEMKTLEMLCDAGLPRSAVWFSKL